MSPELVLKQKEGDAPDSQPRTRLSTTILKWIIGGVKQFLFRPLIAALIGAMIIGRLVTGVIGPDQYKVYLVGPFDRQSDAAGEMWKKLASSPVGKLDGVQVSFDKENDHGDETTAIRIAENLARRANTLMVIGHLVSTQTRAALPAYLQSVTPAIPVILTTETNPRLVPPSGRSDGFVPIFRLSPTDEDQAEVAAAFVIKKGGKAVWVAESGENPVYSEFLATRFIDQIQKKSDGKCRTVLWSRKFDNQLADAIDKFGIDWVFFLGDWRTGLVLARQISSMKKSEAVSVLLSDSAMDKDLAKSADHDARNIYLMFPLAAKTFEGGYGVYASDAASVISSLIAEANRDFQRYAKEGNERRWRLHRLLGLKRVADARNAIGNVMKAAELRSDTLPLDLTDLPRAQFCAGGLVKGRSFDVWQVTQGKFLPANGLRSNAPDDRCPDPGSG